MIQWYFLALISALFSAGAAVVQKKVLFKESAINFVFVLALFNLVISIPFFFFIESGSLNYTNLLVLFIRTLLEGVGFLCVMIGIKNLELSRALPLLVLTPGLVAFLAFFILGESICSLALLGMLLLLAGTYILQLGESKFSVPFRAFINSKGHKYLVIALFVFAFSAVLDKSLLKGFGLPINAFMGFQHLFYALIFFVILLFMGGVKSVSFKNSWKWILLVALFTITYRYTYLWSVRDSSSVALALSMKRTAVFFAILVGGRLFKEHDFWKRVLATLVMIIGAILIIVY